MLWQPIFVKLTFLIALEHLTIIDRLQDPDFFFDDMTDSINGRIEAFSKTNPLSSPAFVASAIGSR